MQFDRRYSEMGPMHSPVHHQATIGQSPSRLASAAVAAPRKPTVQDMYNTWRALQEHMNEIKRLPMRFRAEMGFCHECHIFKRQCVCFDYSQLEVAYQERDAALRNKALHETAPIELTRAGRSSGRAKAKTAGWPRLPQTPTPTPAKATPRTPRLAASAAYYATPSSDTKRRDQPRHTAPKKGPAKETDTGLVNYERRAIVMTRQHVRPKLGRRWRCMFGADVPGSPVCTREDASIETIRRHYGREHGKHRYHRRPEVVHRCDRCDYEVQSTDMVWVPVETDGTATEHAAGTEDEKDAQRQAGDAPKRQHKLMHPPTCPACQHTTIWVGEMRAVIEVPVPVCRVEEPTAPTEAKPELRSEPAAEPQPQPSPVSPKTPRLDDFNTPPIDRLEDFGPPPIDPRLEDFGPPVIDPRLSHGETTPKSSVSIASPATAVTPALARGLGESFFDNASVPAFTYNTQPMPLPSSLTAAGPPMQHFLQSDYPSTDFFGNGGSLPTTATANGYAAQYVPDSNLSTLPTSMMDLLSYFHVPLSYFP